MLLMIDNYDSFTYNLYQYLSELGAEVVTVRNDKITLAEIEHLEPQGIVVSPGPCTPTEAGVSNEVIRHFGHQLPVLGVCLGHQCMGEVYGGTVGRAGGDSPRQNLTDSPYGQRASWPACPTPLRASGTTPWWCIPIPFPIAWKLRRGLTTA